MEITWVTNDEWGGALSAGNLGRFPRGLQTTPNGPLTLEGIRKGGSERFITLSSVSTGTRYWIAHSSDTYLGHSAARSP